MEESDNDESKMEEEDEEKDDGEVFEEEEKEEEDGGDDDNTNNDNDVKRKENMLKKKIVNFFSKSRGKKRKSESIDDGRSLKLKKGENLPYLSINNVSLNNVVLKESSIQIPWKLKSEIFEVTVQDKIYPILVRDCFKDIYEDIVENVYQREHPELDSSQESDQKSSFKPQCCFLIYGNDGIGKTALCHYLAYRFKEESFFDNCDIIVIADPRIDNVQKCSIRFAGENKYSHGTKIPGKRKNPSIIISDNIPIHEDEYSEDDVVIMLSEPKAENYKIFRNKREPLQRYILQLNDDEIMEILKLYNRMDLLEKAKEFGGNLVYTLSGKELDNEIKTFDKNIICSYIPGEYDQRFFIYDTKKFNVIPDRIRFISEEMERLILFNNYQKKEDCKMLLDAYERSGDGKIFERIMHIFLGNEEVIFSKERNIICKADKSFIYDHDFVYKVLKEYTDNQCYVDLSAYPTFPAVDGLLIGDDGIAGVQMTISGTHNYKDNVIVLQSVYYSF